MTTDQLAEQLQHLQKQLSRLRLQTLRRHNPDKANHPTLNSAINKCIAAIASNRYDHAHASEALDEAETLADVLTHPTNRQP